VIAIRRLETADAPACDEIVAGLPEWFGDPDGVRACAAAIRAQEGLVALDGERIVAFLTWTRDGATAEITWMATRAEARRSGAGRHLIEILVGHLVADGVRELHVKTLSERDPYPPYAETRAFYRAMGFAPVRELDIWGPENPAVLMVRDL
jgi:ribosomal protein S18 acetylase RimI-like enzyme